MATTIRMPAHMPTLKIPSIASQELNDTINKIKTGSNRLFFIFMRFRTTMQKPYRAKQYLYEPYKTSPVLH